MKKLSISQQYIKNTDSSELLPLVMKSISKPWDVTIAMVDLIKESIETLNVIEEKLEIFFQYTPMLIDNNDLFTFINDFRIALDNKNTIDSDSFKQIVSDLKSQNNLSVNIWKPIRIVLTGKEHGPDIGKVVEILGHKECSRRLSLFLSHNES